MNRKIIVAAIGFVLAVALGLHFWAEWEKVRFDASLPEVPAIEATETNVVEAAQQETAGHLHNGTQLETPEGIPTSEHPPTGRSALSEIPPGDYFDFSQFSEEQLREMVAQYWRQLDVPPPPEGYTYIWDDDPQHELGKTARRDENGQPILLPEGDPIFTVTTELGFRPTPEQFARYEEVRKELDRLYGLDPGRVQQLKAQLEQMRREYVGEIPSVHWSNYFPTDWTEEQIRAAEWRDSEAAARLKYAEYRKMGLDYLIPPQYR